MKVLGICSGYFAPLHDGHIDYLRAAKRNCDELWVIVNNDIQLKAKKGYIPMTQGARLKVMRAIYDVDSVYISEDNDNTVTNTLRKIVDYVEDEYDFDLILFFNDGDATNPPEHVDGVINVFLGNEKVNSSTEILSHGK